MVDHLVSVWRHSRLAGMPCRMLLCYGLMCTALLTHVDIVKGDLVNGDEPEFEYPIGNITTPLSKEAILTCAVNNLGKHRVGWLKAEDQTVLSMHTNLISHNPRYSLMHDNHKLWQLHIRQVKEQDRGCYMCQVNTKVMKKQIGCLDVHVPPDIVYEETSSDLAVLEGDNATLECKAVGHPTPRVTWRREDGTNMIIRRTLRDVAVDRVDSYQGTKLTLWRVDRRQMGAYLCIASNEVPPAVSKRIILSVNFAPSIKVPNQLLGSPLGTDVHLECHVEAFPNTINYWLKNRGEMLLDGNRYSIYENKSNYRVIMRLIIRKFVYSDIGTYNCVSTNSLGRAEGTLRLYEIKLHHTIESDQSDKQAAFLGGLSETTNSQHNTELNDGSESSVSSSSTSSSSSSSSSSMVFSPEISILSCLTSIYSCTRVIPIILTNNLKYLVIR